MRRGQGGASACDHRCPPRVPGLPGAHTSVHPSAWPSNRSQVSPFTTTGPLVLKDTWKSTVSAERQAEAGSHHPETPGPCPTLGAQAHKGSRLGSWERHARTQRPARVPDKGNNELQQPLRYLGVPWPRGLAGLHLHTGYPDCLPTKKQLKMLIK